MSKPRHNFGPKEKPQNVKKSLKRILCYIADSKALFISIIFVVILYTIANLYNNLLIKDVIGALGSYNVDLNEFVVLPDEKAFYTALFTLGAVSLIYVVLQYFSSLLGAYLSTKTVRKLRNDLFGKIVKLPIAYVDTHAHGDIMSRMTNDVDNISNAITQSITSLISGVLTIIGCLAIMIWYSPLLTIVAFVVLGLTLLLSKFMSKYMRPLFSKQQAILGSLNTKTEECVSGCKTVMANNHQEIAIAEFNKQSDEFTKVGIKAQILGGSMGPMMNFIGNVGYFLVCVCGSLFILNGIGNTLLGEPLTVAIVIMFLTTTKQFSRPINEIAQLYSSLLSALAGAERVFAILDEEIEDFSGKIELGDINGRIYFNHMCFGYKKDTPVLKDFDVEVYSGHKIALVGATGSGKTTIVNLLLRFYDLDSGRILIDNKDIKDVSKKELRKNISIVLQDPVLFGDTVLNNIRYGNMEASEEDINRALEMANCKSFVDNLPEGKNTILTEGASNISQGQRQLLTIARALLADPKILILDEATSSVDTRTEMHIQDAMVKLMKDRTSIIIAHRLSTIQDADLIVVLDQGRVVEMGNHRELIALNGAYNRLYQTQFKGMEI